MAIIKKKIINNDTNKPIDGATVQLIGSNGAVVQTRITDTAGVVSFVTNSPFSSIKVTHVEYEPLTLNILEVNFTDDVYYLYPVLEILDPVVVSNPKDNKSGSNLWMWLVGIGVIGTGLYYANKKKSKLNAPPIVII